MKRCPLSSALSCRSGSARLRAICRGATPGGLIHDQVTGGQPIGDWGKRATLLFMSASRGSGHDGPYPPPISFIGTIDTYAPVIHGQTLLRADINPPITIHDPHLSSAGGKVKPFFQPGTTAEHLGWFSASAKKCSMYTFMRLPEEIPCRDVHLARCLQFAMHKFRLSLFVKDLEPGGSTTFCFLIV